MADDTTLHLKQCLSRLREGDATARHDLINAACDRLTRLTRKMFRSSPRLRAVAETGDVFQNAALRLCRALQTVVPATVLDFYRLAALQIRRELIDLARHHSGPVAVPLGTEAEGTEPADREHDAPALALWCEFHQSVAEMPDAERTVFDLIFYQGFTHAQAAEELGVSTKTVQTRWRDGRLWLHERLKGEFPPLS